MTADATDLMFRAASFAARAHKNQLRKDGQTPYVAHPFRACLVVRHVFGVDDPRVLTAALLHDTIEDTTTDFDDIAEAFGVDVARWVAALTKDMRLEDGPREAEYHRVLAAAGWPVVVCKLADIYDNLSDSKTLSTKGTERNIRRATEYLDAMRPTLPAEAKAAFAVVEGKLAAMKT
ncbi:HD domain-containing protein [Fimbriiglobus ruber]|uniref:GTP pyrophosphokinase n=1 Tax=Fimbriiglobus ruber TaxID=1908690 RepID=A0A225E5E7_9BACT|nr:HD domain-containing protein [Fimbriiglobus ruber]OWK46994.1 GTP pyrophosphokinase [Fimbriiglobus ruber]